MKRTITVMNYLEVVGSIAQYYDEVEYKNFFKNYKEAKEEDRGTLVFYAVRQGEISGIESIADNMVQFLNLPDDEYWFIHTWNNEYIENK